MATAGAGRQFCAHRYVCLCSRCASLPEQRVGWIGLFAYCNMAPCAHHTTTSRRTLRRVQSDCHISPGSIIYCNCVVGLCYTTGTSYIPPVVLSGEYYLACQTAHQTCKKLGSCIRTGGSRHPASAHSPPAAEAAANSLNRLRCTGPSFTRLRIFRRLHVALRRIWRHTPLTPSPAYLRLPCSTAAS